MTGILDEKIEELGSVDHFATERMEVGETTASTEGVAHFPQHRLMPMLWENALEKAKKRRENDDDDDFDSYLNLQSETTLPLLKQNLDIDNEINHLTTSPTKSNQAK